MNAVVAFIAAKTGMEVSAIESALNDWEQNDILGDGVPIGTIIIKGTEVHMALAPECKERRFRRRQIQEFLAPYYNRLGFLTTRILINQTDAQEFVKRVGFRQTHTDGTFNYFLLADLPFKRAST